MNPSPAEARTELCPFCGSQDHHRRFITSLGESVICCSCGGVANRNSANSYVYTAKYYEQNYAPIQEQQLSRFRGLLGLLDGLNTEHSLLDVGCGTGLFLKSAWELGYRRSLGIDLSQEALQLARRNLCGTDVALQLNTAPIVGSFGVISFMDSIGHIAEINQVFGALVNENLQKGGVIIVKTPRFSNQVLRYGLLLGQVLGLVGKSALVSQGLFHLPARLSLFTETALEAIAKKHGLSITSLLIQREYSRRPEKCFTIKQSLVDLMLRSIPDRLGAKSSLVLIARKD